MKCSVLHEKWRKSFSLVFILYACQLLNMAFLVNHFPYLICIYRLGKAQRIYYWLIDIYRNKYCTNYVDEHKDNWITGQAAFDITIPMYEALLEWWNQFSGSSLNELAVNHGRYDPPISCGRVIKLSVNIIYAISCFPQYFYVMVFIVKVSLKKSTKFE